MHRYGVPTFLYPEDCRSRPYHKGANLALGPAKDAQFQAGATHATRIIPDMSVSEIDPLKDPRWAALVNSNPRASVFHTPQWLEALKRTYDYVPLALTTSPDLGPLANGVAFCRVDSWLTGSRLVSV